MLKFQVYLRYLSLSSYSEVNAFFQVATFRFFAQRNPYTETLTNLFPLILCMLM